MLPLTLTLTQAHRDGTLRQRTFRQPHRRTGSLARILVVDDEPSVAAAIQMFLEHAGFEVVIADSGCSGLQAIATSDIDVIVLDIFLPGMTGFEAIREFRRRAPTIPIIAMTGYLFRDGLDLPADLLARAMEIGANACLQKPFRPSKLMSAVEACLNETSSSGDEVADVRTR